MEGPQQPPIRCQTPQCSGGGEAPGKGAFSPLQPFPFWPCRLKDATQAAQEAAMFI